MHKVNDVAANKAKSGMTQQVRNIGGRAGQKIVQTKNLGAAFDERLAQVTAEKTGPTGHHDAG